MTQQEVQNLVEAIRLDDAAAFDAALGARKCVRLGRFPILSVCYLYSARRILRTYTAAMQQGVPLELPEPRDVYRDFLPVAGKALRYFVGEGAMAVHPAYMLALLGKWRHLRATFSSWRLDSEQQKILCNLLAMRYSVRAHVTGGKLVLPPRPLLPAHRIGVATVVVVSCILLAFAVVALTLGTPSRGQLLLIDGAQSAIVLDGDITLSGQVDTTALCIDGRGHTITVPVSDTPYMRVFAGELRDCTLRLICPDLCIGQAWAAFCLENRGTLQNVNIVVEATLPPAGDDGAETAGVLDENHIATITLVDFAKETDDEGNERAADCGFGIFCVDNYGSITGGTVSGAWQWVGDGNVDAQVGALAAYNYGTISGVTLSAQVVADTADMGGVAFRNEEDGTIEGCRYTSDGYVIQSTSVFLWSPMVGGVVAHNYGLVSDCRVDCEVRAIKLNVTFPEGQESVPLSSAVCGGIAAFNYGSVRHCLMTGRALAGSGITTFHYATVAMVGGIVGENIRAQDAPAGELRENIMLGVAYGNGYCNYVGGICGSTSANLYANCFAGTVYYNTYNMASYANNMGTLAGEIVADSETLETTFADNRLLYIEERTYFDVYVYPMVGYYSTGEEAYTPVALTQMTGATSHSADELATQKEFWYEG